MEEMSNVVSLHFEIQDPNYIMHLLIIGYVNIYFAISGTFDRSERGVWYIYITMVNLSALIHQVFVQCNMFKDHRNNIIIKVVSTG